MVKKKFYVKSVLLFWFAENVDRLGLYNKNIRLPCLRLPFFSFFSCLIVFLLQISPKALLILMQSRYHKRIIQISFRKVISRYFEGRRWYCSTFHIQKRISFTTIIHKIYKNISANYCPIRKTSRKHTLTFNWEGTVVKECNDQIHSARTKREIGNKFRWVSTIIKLGTIISFWVWGSVSRVE